MSLICTGPFGQVKHRLRIFPKSQFNSIFNSSFLFLSYCITVLNYMPAKLVAVLYPITDAMCSFRPWTRTVHYSTFISYTKEYASPFNTLKSPHSSPCVSYTRVYKAHLVVVLFWATYTPRHSLLIAESCRAVIIIIRNNPGLYLRQTRGPQHLTSSIKWKKLDVKSSNDSFRFYWALKSDWFYRLKAYHKKVHIYELLTFILKLYIYPKKNKQSSAVWLQFSNSPKDAFTNLIF